ncbi:hypothetical protein PLICRDRAFT_174497 [Plicaturopsis crispa FD-325 SS-3]|nr:hypothetical protein PLICRDRAFT_174497 [Plicaturopsis crispa FD-325 SS-3]
MEYYRMRMEEKRAVGENWKYTVDEDGLFQNPRPAPRPPPVDPLAPELEPLRYTVTRPKAVDLLSPKSTKFFGPAQMLDHHATVDVKENSSPAEKIRCASSSPARRFFSFGKKSSKGNTTGPGTRGLKPQKSATFNSDPPPPAHQLSSSRSTPNLLKPANHANSVDPHDTRPLAPPVPKIPQVHRASTISHPPVPQAKVEPLRIKAQSAARRPSPIAVPIYKERDDVETPSMDPTGLYLDVREWDVSTHSAKMFIVGPDSST